MIASYWRLLTSESHDRLNTEGASRGLENSERRHGVLGVDRRRSAAQQRIAQQRVEAGPISRLGRNWDASFAGDEPPPLPLLWSSPIGRRGGAGTAAQCRFLWIQAGDEKGGGRSLYTQARTG